MNHDITPEELKALAAEHTEVRNRMMYKVDTIHNPLSTNASTYQGARNPSVDADTRLSALNKQVNGDHYEDLSIQPWTVMESILTEEEFIGYLKGSVLKYSLRLGRKEGTDDVNKIKHYMAKLLEMEQR